MAPSKKSATASTKSLKRKLAPSPAPTVIEPSSSEEEVVRPSSTASRPAVVKGAKASASSPAVASTSKPRPKPRPLGVPGKKDASRAAPGASASAPPRPSKRVKVDVTDARSPTPPPAPRLPLDQTIFGVAIPQDTKTFPRAFRLDGWNDAVFLCQPKPISRNVMALVRPPRTRRSDEQLEAYFRDNLHENHLVSASFDDFSSAAFYRTDVGKQIAVYDTPAKCFQRVRRLLDGLEKALGLYHLVEEHRRQVAVVDDPASLPFVRPFPSPRKPQYQDVPMLDLSKASTDAEMTEMLKRQQELREIQAEHNRDLDEKAAVDYRRSLVVWREERALQVAKHNDLEDRRADQVQAYNAAVTEMAEDTVSFVNTVGEYALFLLDQQRGGGGAGESATPPPAQPDKTISAVDGEESEEESPPPYSGGLVAKTHPAPPPPRRRRLSDATAVSGGSGDGGDDQEGEGDGEGEEEDEDEDGGSEGEPEGKQRAAGSSGKAPARRRHRGPHVSVPPCFSHIRNPTMLEGFYDHDFHDLEPLNEVAPFDPRKKPRPDKKHPRLITGGFRVSRNPDVIYLARGFEEHGITVGSMGVLVVFTRGAGCRLCKEHHWACLRVRTGLQMEAHCIRCRALKRTCVPHTRHTFTATPGVEFEPFDWTYSVIQVNKHYFELYIRMFVDVMERQTRLNMREVLLGMALALRTGEAVPADPNADILPLGRDWCEVSPFITPEVKKMAKSAAAGTVFAPVIARSEKIVAAVVGSSSPAARAERVIRSTLEALNAQVAELTGELALLQLGVATEEFRELKVDDRGEGSSKGARRGGGDVVMASVAGGSTGAQRAPVSTPPAAARTSSSSRASPSVPRTPAPIPGSSRAGPASYAKRPLYVPPPVPSRSVWVTPSTLPVAYRVPSYSSASGVPATAPHTPILGASSSSLAAALGPMPVRFSTSPETAVSTLAAPLAAAPFQGMEEIGVEGFDRDAARDEEAEAGNALAPANTSAMEGDAGGNAGEGEAGGA
ncbi:hypothetical protein B0H15DRAFT_957672 [Mycena belliarum]|uniref:Uncharacterized protein n=1 Tax=Mycena belliarum TaxID=1033014 RepID=A0AAD6XGG1_9AGAR|nr:hypothetical protein B0H15DRAFT_957672 [Mycena belliae]